MLRDAVRGVVVVAAEIAEEAGKRVVDTAAGLLERSGVDVAAIERRVSEQFPPTVRSLQTLADEAVTAGRAGVDLVTGVARSEVDRIFERVGDQVTKVGVVLGYLESRLREAEEPTLRPDAGSGTGTGAEPGTEARADALFHAGWEEEPEPVPEPIPLDEPEPEPKPAAKKAPAKKPPAKKAAAAKKTTPAKTTAKKTTPAKTTAKKTTAKKTTAKQAAPRKSASKKVTDD